MAENHGDWAFKLDFPNTLTGGQKLSYLQNQDQLNLQRQDRLDRQNERDDAKRGRYLNSEIDDISKLHTGLDQFDNWTNSKASDILKKFTTDPNYANLPPADFEAALNRDWLPIVQGYNSVKGKLQAETNSINELTQQQKWIDKDALTTDTYKNIAGEYFQKDKDGNINFKPIDSVDFSKPIASNLVNADDSYKYVNSAAIDDFTKNLNAGIGTPYTGIWMDSNGGSRTYTGKLSSFQKADVAPNDKGFINANPTFSIATEGKTDEQGDPVNTLSEDVIKNHMANTGVRQKAMQKMFHDYADQNGIDLSKLNPQQRDTELKKFAYTVAKNSITNQPELHSYERPPHISTTVNLPKETNISDVYGEINSKGANVPANGFIPFNELSNTAQQVLAKGLVGEDDKKLGIGDLAVSKDKDGNWVLSNVQTNDDGSVQKIKDLYKITYSGVNLPANTSQKQKQVILHNQQKENHSNIDADPLGILK